MDLGRLLEALFGMKLNPAHLPLTSRDRFAQPSLSACIMGDLSLDGKLVDRMLTPAARTQDMGKRMKISVMLTRVHEIRAFFAETHGLVSEHRVPNSRQQARLISRLLGRDGTRV